MPFSAEARAALTGLAEGLLPLQDWITSPTHTYIPPDAKDLPWRTGEVLTHERLRTISYVEWLVAASDADDLLLARWEHLRQDPLAYCPLETPRAFREGRGLSQAPRFATVEAGNALADASGRQMSRRYLYDQCIPLLVAAAKQAQRREEPPTWTALATELHQGNCPEWRAVAGAPQSTLLTEQFLRDVLTSLLNGWLDVASPWRYAVLIELGEYRRPGNAYLRSDVETALETFKAALGGGAFSTVDVESSEQSDAVSHATQWKSVP